MSERKPRTLDIEAIRKILPHRHPFLLVDRIVDLIPGESATGLKCVTANEDFFRGHFPGHSIMPGVLIVEAMAQVAGVMLLSVPEHAGKLAVFAGIDRAKFRRPVVPGDVMVTDVQVLKLRGSIGKASVVARVEGQVVAEGEFMFALVSNPQDQESADGTLTLAE